MENILIYVRVSVKGFITYYEVYSVSHISSIPNGDLFLLFCIHAYHRFLIKIHFDFHFQEALQHPVVRMLIKRKWQDYGHWFLRYNYVNAVVYLYSGYCM